MIGETDLLIGDLHPRAPRAYGRFVVRMVLINELIALPVALILMTSGTSLLTAMGIAHIYSQTVGGLCASVGLATSRWMHAQPPRRRLVLLLAQYFAAGVAGAEIARRLCLSIYGAQIDAGPPVVVWAIGATIALIVSLILMTLGQLREKVVSTELLALQARINPHFLFNTLNSIAALTRVDPVRAETMTLRLSALFRYTLEAPRRGLVSLEEELVIVRGYLAIEQERLASRLTYEVDVDEALLRLRVPALTLQPLVENAIKHGISADVGGGTVKVRGWREGDVVHLAVTDSGRGKSQAPGTGEGLDNIRGRLRATYGPRSAVTLNVTGEWTEARLSFPAPAGDAL